MDDAREWIASAGRARAPGAEVVQPGDPWGAPAPRAEAPVGALAPAPPRPAGFWRRGAALAVDLLVLAVLRLVGDGLTAGVGTLAPTGPLVAQAFGISWKLVVPAAYFVLAHGSGGRTLGKQVLGIRVVGARGEPVGYVQALGRLVATVVAVLPAGLGLALAALRRDRRGAHDLLAGTRVVRLPGGGGWPA